MALIGSYLSSRRWIILWTAFTCGIFALVFSLYDLPMAAVGYAASICGCAGLIALAVDAWAFRQRHRQLSELQRQPEAAPGLLPPPANTLEADYQALLTAVCAQWQALETQMERHYQDQTDYFTMWVHQIKTPIAAARLLLQSEQHPSCQELRDELMRIEQYVSMVLEYLRLDAVTTDYVITRVDLDTVCRQAVRKYASQFIRRGLRLFYEDMDCTVLTDAKWLGFVIEQLLSNALKYTRSGSITLRLEQPRTLCIQDTGIGIAPEDLPRVHEMGYTGYNGRTANPNASGIGLYLCHRIVQQLGHTLTITSRLDVGTTVRIGLDSADLWLE